MHEWISNSHAERIAPRMLRIIVMFEWERSFESGRCVSGPIRKRKKQYSVRLEEGFQFTGVDLYQLPD